MNADGSLAKPPIALAEVQGYVYLRRRGMADLPRAPGTGTAPGRLRLEGGGGAAQARFKRDFWLADVRACYAAGAGRRRAPAAAIGHV